MPTSPKPLRVQRSVTLPAALNDELQRQADQRILNPSLLVERALAAYLPSLPSLDGDTPTP